MPSAVPPQFVLYCYSDALIPVTSKKLANQGFAITG